MSARKRREAREKIDKVINYAEATAAAGEADVTRNACEGIADIVFGIWKALDEIADSMSGKKNGDS